MGSAPCSCQESDASVAIRRLDHSVRRRFNDVHWAGTRGKVESAGEIGPVYARRTRIGDPRLVVPFLAIWSECPEYAVQAAPGAVCAHDGGWHASRARMFGGRREGRYSLEPDCLAVRSNGGQSRSRGVPVRTSIHRMRLHRCCSVCWGMYRHMHTHRCCVGHG